MNLTLSCLFLVFLLCNFSCTESNQFEKQEKNTETSKGYILSSEEGEILMGKSKRGDIKIKASPKTGSQNLAMGTQKLSPKSKIPIHVHHTADEILFVHEGSGTGFINSDSEYIETGSTIFIPAGVWHGIENANNEMEILWFVTPPGLDQFFRDLDSANVSGMKSLTAEDIEEIAQKHGDSYLPQK